MEGKEVKVNIALPKLEAGKIFTMDHINFYGGQAIVISNSLPVMRRLLRLMRQNPGLEIRICGHVNGCDQDPNYLQKLSEDRAKTLFDFLVLNGINKSRMSTIGYSCTKMLYPSPKNEFENEQNRRVEVEVLKY